MSDIEPLPPHLRGAEPEIAAELDEALMVGALADVERVTRWQIETLDDAEWCLRRLRALTAREKAINVQYAAWRARVDAEYAEWMAPLDEWREAEERRLASSLAFFGERLQTFALRQRALNPKENKTTYLPGGRVETRGGSPRIVVHDEDAVIAWLYQHWDGDDLHEVIVRTEKVSLSHLRSKFKVHTRTVPFGPDDEGPPVEVTDIVDTSTGAVVEVPGLSIEWPQTTATVKVNDD